MISNPSNLTDQILNLCERVATELKAIYNKLKTATYSVNNIKPTSDGNITIGDATTSASGLMSKDDKTKLNGIATGANKYTHPTSHAASMITGLATVATSGSYNDLSNKPTIPAAYTLPNATDKVLGGVKVGSNITVSSGTISLTKSNVTSALGYTPPTKDTTYSAASTSAAGLMSAADKTKLDGIAEGANKYTYTLPTAGSSLGGVKTTSTVTSTSGLTACPIISGVPYYKDTNNTYTLSSFGITATAAELNYCDGVKSNIQTQLDGKLSTSGTAAKATADASGNNIVNTYLTKTAAGNTYAALSSATVTFTGDIKAKTFQATSDKRLKTIVNEVNDVDLSNIKTYSYFFTNDSNERVRYGVMAQDVKEVLPYAVSIGNDGYYSVDYNGLVAILIAKINKLENQLNNLKI